MCGDLSLVSSVHDDLYAVRRSARFISFIGVVFIRRNTGDALAIIQDGAFDAFQHPGRPGINLVGVGFSELAVCFIEPASNVGSYILNTLEAGDCLYDVGYRSIRKENISVLFRGESDYRADSGGGEVFREDKGVVCRRFHGLNRKDKGALIDFDLEGIIVNQISKPIQNVDFRILRFGGVVIRGCVKRNSEQPAQTC